MSLPLAVTIGDPAGIGGEITLAAWLKRPLQGRAFYMIGDADHMAAVADAIGSTCRIVKIDAPCDAADVFCEALPVLHRPLMVKQTAGRPEPENAEAVIQSISLAVHHVQTGQAAGLVTNPINKKALYDGAGFVFPGHTEFLGDLAGVRRTVMMLASPVLRVVPVTVHVSLRMACEQLSQQAIVETACILDADLKRFFGLEAPVIAVSGLNPHAGEGGTMGHEEQEIIQPAIECLKRKGIRVKGPLPADTMFHDAARAQYDAALCMYHDQALIPLKALDFARGVNVTLGLPFIRTSPDHGTAYDIAGTGKADPDSLIEALRLASRMAEAVA